MARKTFTAVVAGTGFHSDLIKAFARKGSAVQLRRTPGSRHPNAVSVWLRCQRFWGLWTTWAQIGFIQPDGENAWADMVDSRSLRVVKAWVHSAYAPLDHHRPEVLLRVTFEGE